MQVSHGFTCLKTMPTKKGPGFTVVNGTKSVALVSDYVLVSVSDAHRYRQFYAQKCAKYVQRMEERKREREIS